MAPPTKQDDLYQMLIKVTNGGKKGLGLAQVHYLAKSNGIYSSSKAIANALRCLDLMGRIYIENSWVKVKNDIPPSPSYQMSQKSEVPPPLSGGHTSTEKTE